MVRFYFGMFFKNVEIMIKKDLVIPTFFGILAE